MSTHDPKSNDPINPNHYKVNGLECIDVIESLDLPFHLANALKYIWRAGRKDSAIEDIKKARWYLDRYINAHVVTSVPADWCDVKITPTNITETLKPEYTYIYNYEGDKPYLCFANEFSARWCVDALNSGARTPEEYKSHKMAAGVVMSQSWSVVEV